MQERRYGTWAGNKDGVPEDKTRCVKGVYDARWPVKHQCNRKRGHGPNGLYCKQHDPAAEAARDKAGQVAYRKRQRRDKLLYGGRYIAALRKIAEGHNDPRALAIEALSDLEEPLE